MGCIKSTKKILREIAKEITPHLIKFAVDKVRAVEEVAAAFPHNDTNYTAFDKGEIVSNMIEVEAAASGIDLPRRRVNLLREFAVEAVFGDEDESELGMDDRGDED